MGKRALLLIALIGCGSKGNGGPEDPCRRALAHAAKVYEASDAPAELKQQARDGFEAGVEACQAEHAPAAVLDCTLAAVTVDDLKRCDTLRERGGDRKPPAPPPDAAPPDASDGERAAQLLDSGRAAEAVPILRKQLDRVIAANGEHNILTAGALNNLGVALEKAGDLDGAIEMLERSLKIREGISGPSDPMTLALRERLAKLRAQRGHQ